MPSPMEHRVHGDMISIDGTRRGIQFQNLPQPLKLRRRQAALNKPRQQRRKLGIGNRRATSLSSLFGIQLARMQSANSPRIR